MTGEKPRQIAAQILQRHRTGGGYVEDILDSALNGSALSGVDRALCQELVFGAVRWQATLDWLIDRRTGGRTQKPMLRDLLRLGLYQIFWLDRIPAHAAVHESVELAKQNGFGPQAGFVNAILRGYLRDADTTRAALLELKKSAPHVGLSHPEWLVKRWTERWGVEKTAQLLEWNNTPPATYARVNRLKTDPGALLTRWREENVDYDFVRRDWLDESQVFELKAHPPLAKLGSFQEGWFYVQDPSTLLAVRELMAGAGESVLDMCSAPGGKTVFIAEQMRNEGRLVATDASPDRLKLVAENCQRLGVTCVETSQLATCSLQPSTFNRILVDAPCSNTGVMRRRVDLRWRLRPEEIDRLKSVQLSLLQAAQGLKRGGFLIYSTCSLEPQENQEVVAGFLKSAPAFRLVQERTLLPFVDGVDGAYVAVLSIPS